MSYVRQLAEQIVWKYKTDAEFAKVVDGSNEPYRAMVYECGFVLVDWSDFDGSDEWAKLIDEIESLMQY